MVERDDSVSPVKTDKSKSGSRLDRFGDKHKPFLPGQSGNPNGRPKKVQQVVDKAQANADKALTKLVKLIDSDDDRVALQAAQAVLDRAVGKPKQTIEDGRKSGASDYTVDELRAIARMGSTGTAQARASETKPDQLQPLHAPLVHAGGSSRDDRGEVGSGFTRRN